MIINNAPLTYVFPNTIETSLIPNHLLFGRQLFYFFNITSTVVRNATVLSSTTDNHFLGRWRHEYVVHLREAQRTSKLNINSLEIIANDIVLVFYEKVLRHLRIVIVLR